jgi:DNA-binding transcriptional ArsR family regulator
MVNYSAPSLDRTFSALSDPTRRAILGRLAQGEATVTELARPFDMSLPAVSKHLRVLENAGLLTRRKEGRIHHVGLAAAPLQGAADWLDFYRSFWEARFDSLADFLEKMGQEDGEIVDRPDSLSGSTAESKDTNGAS